MSNDLVTPILVAVGVIGSAYLTYLGTTYKYRNKPKDPATELFNYYDTLLKNALAQSRAKDILIDKLEANIDKIQQELWDTKQLLKEAKEQLAESTRQGEEVRQHITDARTALKDSEMTE